MQKILLRVLLIDVNAKKPLRQHFTNAVAQKDDWTVKLEVLEGFKGYFCIFEMLSLRYNF
jgi:hypothetical protein